MHVTARKHFGFTLDPFESNRDVRFFCDEGAHREALARMRYLADDGNMMVGLLTGEIGCGKTMTAAMLLRHLRQQGRPVAFLPFSDMDFDGILAEVLTQLGAPVEGDRQARLHRMRDFLIRRGGAGLALLLDEAQQLDLEVLDRLRALTNIGSAEANLMTLLLVGQPDLERKVAAMPQLSQRVSLRFHLGPLDAAQTVSYITYRTRVAGYPTGELFTPDALDTLHQVSHGVPRLINRVAKLSLDIAAATGVHHIDDDLISRVVADQGWQSVFAEGWS